MKCPYCEHENPADAVFCKSCGRRLDGMHLCHHCNKLTPADGQFCIYCGNNLDMPVLKPKVKVEQPVFATTSAVVVKKPKEAKKVEMNDEKSESLVIESKAQRIIHLISMITAGLTVLISFIFLFLIGSSTKVSLNGVSADTGANNYNIYYYFGEAYSSLTGDAAMYGYFGPILGTVSVVLMLVAMIVAIALGIKEVVKHFKTQDFNLTKYAVWTYFIYISAAGLFMLNIASGTSSSTIAANISLNAATIAGIVIGAIFLVATLVLDGILRKIVGSLKSYLIHGLTTLGTVIFGIIGLAFIGKGILSVTTTSDLIPISGTTTYGLTSYSSILFQSATVNFSADEATWSKFISNYILAVIFLILIAVLAVCFFYFFISFAKESLSKLGFGLNKKSALSSLIAGVSLTALGIVEIVFAYLCSFFTPGDPSIVTQVVLIVFGVIILALGIFSFIFQKRNNKTEPVSDEAVKVEEPAAEKPVIQPEQKEEVQV